MAQSTGARDGRVTCKRGNLTATRANIFLLLIISFLPYMLLGPTGVAGSDMRHSDRLESNCSSHDCL